MLEVNVLVVESEQEVFTAMIAVKEGRGSFADALIGALGAKVGCSHTGDLRSEGAAASGLPAPLN